MTLKTIGHRSMLLQALCIISYHRWIETGVTVRKRPLWVKIGDFSARVTLIFDRCPQKKTGNIFSATSSFLYHFEAICEYELEIQSGNAQIEAKIFLPPWSWPLTSDSWVNNREAGDLRRHRTNHDVTVWYTWFVFWLRVFWYRSSLPVLLHLHRDNGKRYHRGSK